MKFTPNTYLAVTERVLEKEWPALETLRLSASRQVAPCRFTPELLKDAMNAADAARRYGYCSVVRVILLDSVLILKKNKCDLNKPECLRCCKAGIKCSGPKDSRTFINRNAANLTQQSDKKALLYALQNRRKSKSTAVEFESSSSSDDSPSRRTTLVATKPSPPSDIISTDFPGRSTFLALIKDFKPAPMGGIFSGDRILRDDPIYSSAALCIRALLPLTSLRIDSLDLPIFSLLTTYMGNLKNDIKLARLAQSSYTSALNKSRPYIQQAIENGQRGAHPKANLELILLLAIAFLAFEVRNWSTNENEFLLLFLTAVSSS